MEIFLRFAAFTDFLPNRVLTCAYDARILYIVSGKGEMHFTDRTVPFAAGTLVYYPPGEPYLPLPDEKDPPRFVTLNFDFNRAHTELSQTLFPVAVEDFEPQQALRSHLHAPPLFQRSFVLSHMEEMQESFLEIAAAFEEMTSAAREKAEALLHYLCCRLSMRQVQESGVYEQILTYLAGHYLTVKNTAEIAAALHYHPYYLSAVFRQKSGTTLHRHILNMRLKKGAELLRRTDRSVAQCAFAAGFRNADHFSKCFLARYGVTPGKFRRGNLLI